MVQQRQQFSEFTNRVLEILRLRESVLGTGHTLKELEQALRDHRRVIKKTEEKAKQCYKDEQKFRERAETATGIRHRTAMLDAKSKQRERQRYEKELLKLSVQRLFFRNMVEHEKERRFEENGMQELGLDSVSVPDLDQEKVIDEIHDSSVGMTDSIPDGLEEMMWSLEHANENTVSPDIDSLKQGMGSADLEEVDGEYSPITEIDEMLEDVMDDMSEDGPQESDLQTDSDNTEP